MADDLAVGTAQILDIGIADEAAFTGDHVFWQSGDLSDLGIERPRRLARERRPRERGEVFVHREMFSLRERSRAECPFALELCGGERGQRQRGAEREMVAAEMKLAFDH